MAKRYPYFPLYVADLLGDQRVLAMSAEEFGCYLLLLCMAWQETPRGSLPDDEVVLARWARVSQDHWSAISKRVLPCFKLQPDGRLYQKKLGLIGAKLDGLSEKRAAAGRAGARKRWTAVKSGTFANGKGHDNGLANASQKHGILQSTENKDITTPSESCGAHGKRSKRSPPSGPHQEAVAAFTDAWAAKYGQAYPFNGGKDGAAVKWCLAQLGGDLGRWQGVVAAYLADGSEFVAETRHSLGVLRATFARYQVDTPKRDKPGGVVGALQGWLASGQGGPGGR